MTELPGLGVLDVGQIVHSPRRPTSEIARHDRIFPGLAACREYLQENGSEKLVKGLQKELKLHSTDKKLTPLDKALSTNLHSTHRETVELSHLEPTESFERPTKPTSYFTAKIAEAMKRRTPGKVDQVALYTLYELRQRIGIQEHELQQMSEAEVDHFLDEAFPLVDQIEKSAATALYNDWVLQARISPHQIPEDKDLIASFKKDYVLNDSYATEAYGTIVGQVLDELVFQDEAISETPTLLAMRSGKNKINRLIRDVTDHGQPQMKELVEFVEGRLDEITLKREIAPVHRQQPPDNIRMNHFGRVLDATLSKLNDGEEILFNDHFTQRIIGGALEHWGQTVMPQSTISPEYRKDLFDIVGIQILRELRGELGLTEKQLSGLKPEETKELVKALKPVVEDIEVFAARALLNHMRKQGIPLPEELPADEDQILALFKEKYRNLQNVPSDVFGTIVGEGVRELLHRQAALDQAKIEHFEELQEAKNNYFEGIRSPQDEKEASRSRRVLDKIGRGRKTVAKAWGKISTGHEGRGIFKKTRTLKQSVVDVGVALAPAEVERAAEDLAEVSHDRILQFGLVGAFYFMRRLNLGPRDVFHPEHIFPKIKDGINWDMVGRSAVRGTATAIAVLGTELVVQQLLQHTGAGAELGMGIDPRYPQFIAGIMDLPVKIAVAKFAVSGAFNALGINTGAESAVNFLRNRKHEIDSFTEYLYFRGIKDEAQMERLTSGKTPPKWKVIVDFLDHKPLDSYEMRNAAEELRWAEIQMRTYKELHSERYQKRQIIRNGETHIIDNDEIFSQIESFQLDLYKQAVHELRHNRTDEIKDILTESPKTTKQQIQRKVLVNRALAGSVGTALNAVYIVGASLPVVKEFGSQLLNTLFGDSQPIPSPQAIDMIPDPGTSKLPVLFESELLTSTNFVEFARVAGPKSDEVLDLVDLYQNTPNLIGPDKLQGHGLTVEDLKAISDTLKANNLTPQDFKLVMRVLLYQDIPHDVPEGTSLFSTLYKNIKGSQEAGDLKGFADTFKSYSSLSDELHRELRERGLEHEVGSRDFSLLPKLGIKPDSLEYQQGFLSAEDQVSLSTDQSFIITHSGKMLLRDKTTGWGQVIDFQPDLDPAIQEKSRFVLGQLQHLINADRAEYDEALSNDSYLAFLSESGKAFKEQSAYIYNIKNLIALVQEDNHTARYAPERMDKLLEEAVQGDPKAFNTLYRDLEAEYAGKTYWTFRSNDPEMRKSLIENVIKGANSFHGRSAQQNLVQSVHAYMANFGAAPLSALNHADPVIYNMTDQLTIDPDASLARLLRGDVELDRELEHLLGMPSVIVQNEGKSYIYNKFAHQSVDMPDHFVDWAQAVEGETHPNSDNFLLSLFNGTAGVKIVTTLRPDSTRQISGASDPAMQLTELIMGGPKSSQTVISALSADYPSFFTRQSADYNLEYLARLVVNANNGTIPKELEDILANVNDPAGVHVTDTEDSIKMLCWKLESYILSRRLLNNYGDAAVVKAWLNYIPLSTKNGENVFGMEAFSRIFFHKHVGELTEAEQALAIANINNPVALSPFLNGGEPLKKDAINRVLPLLVKHAKITQAEADQLAEKIKSVTFPSVDDPMPKEFGNAATTFVSDEQFKPTRPIDGAYDINAAYTQAVGQFNPDLRVPDHAPTTLSTIEGVGVVATVLHPTHEGIPSYVELQGFGSPYEDLRFQTDLHTIVNGLMPDQPDPKTNMYHMILNDPNIPNKNYGVDIPSFEVKMPDGTVKSFPGVGLLLMKDSKVTGYYDPTGVFVNSESLVGLPSEMASTSKTFTFAFLVSEGMDPDQPWGNQPGAIAMIKSPLLPVRNPYAALESMSPNNQLSLRQALAFSSDAAWFRAMQKYFDEHPDAFARYLKFGAKVGLEYVDNDGNSVTKPTAYFPIGTDIKVKGGISAMAYAYQFVDDPEKMFKNMQDGPNKDKLIYAFNEAQKTLTGATFRKTAVNAAYPKTPNVGFFESAWLQAQEGPINGRVIASKTGTLGGRLGIQKQFVEITLEDGTIMYVVIQGQTANGHLKELLKYGSETALPFARVILSQLMNKNPLFVPLANQGQNRKLNAVMQ